MSLATTLKIAKRIGKIPVVSGVCFGFIGNRMLEPYSREAHRLLLEGATPAQIDKVLTDLGMAMGVLAMHDLAGIDVSFLVRESRREVIAHDPGYCKLADALYALGRFGQKTSRGYYLYEGRERKEDPKWSHWPSTSPASWASSAAPSAIRKSMTAACSC